MPLRRGTIRRQPRIEFPRHVARRAPSLPRRGARFLRTPRPAAVPGPRRSATGRARPRLHAAAHSPSALARTCLSHRDGTTSWGSVHYATEHTFACQPCQPPPRSRSATPPTLPFPTRLPARLPRLHAGVGAVLEALAERAGAVEGAELLVEAPLVLQQRLHGLVEVAG